MIKEKAVAFRNDRGQDLAAVVHFPIRETLPPLLIMAHGFAADKVSDNRIFVRFARRACSAGFAVLRFDFTGCGESAGEFSDISISGEIADLRAAIEFAYTIPCLEESPLYLVGYGLGGAVSLCAAAADSRIRGVVCWAPVSNLKALSEAFDRKLRAVMGRNSGAAGIEGAGKVGQWRDFHRDLDAYHPCREIALLAPRPVFLIQGSADTNVPAGQTDELFKAAREPKELHMIQAAAHSFFSYEQELFDTTLERLNEWSRDVWFTADGEGMDADNNGSLLRGRA